MRASVNILNNRASATAWISHFTASNIAMERTLGGMLMRLIVHVLKDDISTYVFH